MSTNALVKFAGVQKTYDGKNLVVRDLNLEIQGGEFLSLLGPSGSGKTTTLMMLAGFESPTAGEIFLDGKPITKTPPHKRNFGMVFQNYALFPHMTVADNVAYPLTVRKLSKSDREDKAKRALDMVQMGGMGDRYPGQLSGGQQQRVALARALVFDPQLVLMDEPLGAVDKQLREHMQIELKALHRQLGLTFIYVTHDQSEALTMSDRVAVFNDGGIQQIDVVTQLYETPVNRFVAGFVGDNTVFDAVVKSAGGAQCQVALPCGTLFSGTSMALHLTARCKPVPGQNASRFTWKDSNQNPTASAPKLPMSSILATTCVLRCTLTGQADATVKVPLSGSAIPQAGQSVWLHMPPEHLRIYL